MPPRRVIGIDAGGTKLLGGVVDEQMVVHHRVHRTWRGDDRQETLDIFTGAVEEIRAAAPEVEAIGFGVPALIERETGIVRWSNHLPALDGVPFGDLMSERLGLPVSVDNDGNASMLAESRGGAAQGASHAVMVCLGTGIGGGLLVNGDVYRGATGVGGEVGHAVLQLHGPDCPGDCPGQGCFEALVSGNAIGREGLRVAEEHPDSQLGRRLAADREISGGLVTELAHDGDPLAREVLQEVGERLGHGLVGLVNTFNPEVIVIGGGAVRAGDMLLEPAREVVAERALPPARELVRIVPAHYGDEAGMMGAALLAFDDLDATS
ncbi:MAG TPA: ROK family protein [Thermoleophilaceae bacterium]